MLVATRLFAQITDDPAVAYFPKGTTTVYDAGIPLLTVSVTVGAAFCAKGHAAVITD